MLVETGAVETVMGVVHLTRPVEDLGSPESVREVVGQRLARLDATDHRAARAGGGGRSRVRLRCRSPGRALEAGRSTRPRQATRSGMIEEIAGLELSYRFSHELVRPALYDRAQRGAQGRAAPAGGRGARRRRPGAHVALAGRPRPPLHAGGADRRSRARSLQPGRGARRAGGARLRRGGRPLHDGARPAGRGSDRAGGDPDRARHRLPSRRAGDGLAGGLPARGRHRRARRATASSSRGRRSGSRTRAGRGGVDREGAVDLVGEAWATLGGGDSGLHVLCCRRSRARGCTRATTSAACGPRSPRNGAQDRRPAGAGGGADPRILVAGADDVEESWPC